jgi:hypothetical protein
MLDPADRVTGYSLAKITCGGAVKGGELLDEWVIGRSVESILALDAETVAAGPILGRAKEYLRLKHLFTLQEALALYIGHSSGGTDRAVVIAGVECDAAGTELRAEILLPILTEKIKACGHCGDACRGA